MIRLTCTSCKATLEMDEAFAGGVCRCQHCGTIQTVPSHLKNAAPAGPYPQPVKAAKSLYQGRAATGLGSSPSSGLDDLADVVASSGLSNSNLSRRGGSRNGTGQPGAAGRAPQQAAPAAAVAAAQQPAGLEYQTPRPKAKPKSATPVMMAIGGGVAALLLVAVGVYLFLPDGGPAPVGPGGGGGGATVVGGGSGTGAPVASGPRFCNTPLTASRVVYVLDRGDASKMLFDPLKAALYASLESLGPDREFEVIFWKRSSDAGLDEGQYPVNGVAKATPEEIENCRRKFEDLTASGATDITEAIKEAMARSPGEVVIATPKGYQMDEATMAAIEQARGNAKKVKIHTISLGGDGASPILKAVAEKTGGTYTEMSERELRAQ